MVHAVNKDYPGMAGDFIKLGFLAQGALAVGGWAGLGWARQGVVGGCCKRWLAPGGCCVTGVFVLRIWGAHASRSLLAAQGLHHPCPWNPCLPWIYPLLLPPPPTPAHSRLQAPMWPPWCPPWKRSGQTPWGSRWQTLISGALPICLLSRLLHCAVLGHAVLRRAALPRYLRAVLWTSMHGLRRRQPDPMSRLYCPCTAGR